jgi:glycosyltransferase involved in cell wall biosynthesis
MYAVLICARNEEKYIGDCLESVAFQTVHPEVVVVVDDGSQDNTYYWAQYHRTLFKRLRVVRRGDRGYSALGTVLMADTYNAGLRILNKYEWDYLLILGADTWIPRDYVETMLYEITPDLGVVSGRYPGLRLNYASATGRFIRRRILDHLGGLLPRSNAWESSVTHCAAYMGYGMRNYPVEIRNMRPPGTPHREYFGKGRAMKELGYTLPYVVARFLRFLKLGRIKAALQTLTGYIIHTPSMPIPAYASYLTEYQKVRIRASIKGRLKW